MDSGQQVTTKPYTLELQRDTQCKEEPFTKQVIDPRYRVSNATIGVASFMINEGDMMKENGVASILVG